MFDENAWSDAEGAPLPSPPAPRPALPAQTAASRRQLRATLRRLEAAARRSPSASGDSAASELESAACPAQPRQRCVPRLPPSAAAACGRGRPAPPPVQAAPAGDSPASRRVAGAGRRRSLHASLPAGAPAAAAEGGGAGEARESAAAAAAAPGQRLSRRQWRNRQKNQRRQKNKFKAAEPAGAAPPAASPLPEQEQEQPAGGGDPRPSSLRLRLEARLEAARFRYINQQLYTRPSREAARLFQEDPEAFAVYHRGFARQVARWPENPLQRFVRYLRNRPASWVVADFGCGDCTLARSIRNKVHCFDVVALDPRVTVCDMAQVPLEAASVDVVVFCLALMGTNLREILEEANRVLRVGGTLLVAEVASRFADLRGFLGALGLLGFQLVSKDVSGSHFYTLELRKEGPPRTGGAGTAKTPSGLALRPCLYKRR